MSTHTPGPYNRFTPALKDGSLYAARTKIEQLEAVNAELLTALKKLLWVCRAEDDEDVVAKEAARTAIAKAEGQS